MIRFLTFHAVVFLCITSYAKTLAYASDFPKTSNAYGITGLNQIPTARMDDAGTARAGATLSHSYSHGFIGLQIAKPLYINLRQTARTSSLEKEPTGVAPGLDFKLRLYEETRYRPEIAFGMNSVLGSRATSSEYLALSKRYYNWDFTGGIAWGALAGNGIIANPATNTLSYLNKHRDVSSQDAAKATDWFSGKEVGLFGGVQYQTAIDGLSLMADITPPPSHLQKDKPKWWSLGFNYSPKDFASFGAAMTGLDSVMARLTFQTNIFDKSDHKNTDNHASSIFLQDIHETQTQYNAVLILDPAHSAAEQIGMATRHIAKTAGPSVTTITLTPMIQGTKARSMTFSRRDFMLANKDIPVSPEEIWRNTTRSSRSGMDFSKGSARVFGLSPVLDFSLGEEETTYLSRVSVIAEEQKPWGYGFVSGNSIRLNAVDNLNKISSFRTANLTPIRSDIDLYTQNPIALERSYLSFINTPITGFHFAATAGYLEEMFAGYGGEFLYRPDQSPFAIGLEGWELYKRDPLTSMATGIYGQKHQTGFLNLYYDIPDTDMTAFAKVGQFIGGDRGVQTGAKMLLPNGMSVKGSITLTNDDSTDVFGGTRNLQAGFNLSIPLGDFKYMPRGSQAKVNTAQMGRDDGAVLDKPIDLHDVTEPASYRHLTRNWQEVLP